MAQRPEHGGGGQNKRRLPIEMPREVNRGQQAGGDIAHIAFNACDLARKVQVFALAELHGCFQQDRSIDEGVTMHLAEAHELCTHFASAPTLGLALIKRALDESWDNDLDAQLDLEREFQREASLTPDYGEGVRAFLEKRAPKFSGRKPR